jgi:hypothetical protein
MPDLDGPFGMILTPGPRPQALRSPFLALSACEDTQLPELTVPMGA